MAVGAASHAIPGDYRAFTHKHRLRRKGMKFMNKPLTKTIE
jgi:hypothetical protein